MGTFLSAFVQIKAHCRLWGLSNKIVRNNRQLAAEMRQAALFFSQMPTQKLPLRDRLGALSAGGAAHPEYVPAVLRAVAERYYPRNQPGTIPHPAPGRAVPRARDLLHRRDYARIRPRARHAATVAPA